MGLLAENPTYFSEEGRPQKNQWKGRQCKNTEMEKKAGNFGGKKRLRQVSPLSIEDHVELDIIRYNFDVPSPISPNYQNDMSPKSRFFFGGKDIVSLKKDMSCYTEKNSGRITPVSTSIGQRLSQLFWKPKSRNSLSSESQASSFYSNNNEIRARSPIFTPESSVSLYTSNSFDSDSHSSNKSHSSGSNKRPSVSETVVSSESKGEDLFDSLHPGGCMKYDNDSSYYNISSTSQHPVRVPGHRGSIDQSRVKDPVSIYYNTNFSTFPNPKRRSASCGDQMKEDYLKFPGILEENGKGSSGSEIQEVFVDVHQRETMKEKSGPFVTPNKESYSLNDTAEQLLQASNDSSSTLVLKSDSREWNGSSGTESDFLVSMKTGRKDQSTVSALKLSSLCPAYLSQATADCELYCSLCASSALKSQKRSSMDVAIVSFEECYLSNNCEEQLKVFFENLVTTNGQKLEVILKSYTLRQLDHPELAAEVHKAKMQILLISHSLLENLKTQAAVKRLWPFNYIFQSKKVIAVLVRVQKSEVLNHYESVLARFHEWFTLEVKTSGKLESKFCKDFSDQILKIYNLELSSVPNFRVFPKKVNKNHSKVILVFKKPINDEEKIVVELKSHGKAITCDPLSKENPFTCFLKLPDKLCQSGDSLVEISVYVSNQPLGKCWVKYEWKDDQEDYIRKMSMMLPNFIPTLDKHIADSLSMDYKKCINVTEDPNLVLLNDALVCRGEEFPTIMHFASFYGLYSTACVALHEGDGLEQSLIRNEKSSKTPMELASDMGFSHIENVIENFHLMTKRTRADKFVEDLGSKNMQFPYETPQKEENEVIDEYVDDKLDSPTTIRFHLMPVPQNSPPGYVNLDMKAPHVTEMVPKSDKSKHSIGASNQSPNVKRKISGRGMACIRNENGSSLGEENYISPPEPRPILPRRNHPPDPVMKKKVDGPIPTDGKYLKMLPKNGSQSSLNFTGNDGDSPRSPSPAVFLDEGIDSKLSDTASQSSASSAINEKLGWESENMQFDDADKILINIMENFKNGDYTQNQVELLYKQSLNDAGVELTTSERKSRLQNLKNFYKNSKKEVKESEKPKLFKKIFRKNSNTEPPNGKALKEASPLESVRGAGAAASHSERTDQFGVTRGTNDRNVSPGSDGSRSTYKVSSKPKQIEISRENQRSPSLSVTSAEDIPPPLPPKKKSPSPFSYVDYTNRKKQLSPKIFKFDIVEHDPPTSRYENQP